MNVRELAAWLALFAAAVTFIITNSRADFQDTAVLGVYWLLLAASWNLLAGIGGQFSFAHVALAMFGGYMSVYFETELGIPPIATILISGLATAILGIALGVVSFRVKGTYLSLISFGFAGVLTVLATGATNITRGYAGVPADAFFMGIDARPYLWLGLAILVVYFVCQTALMRSSFGLQAMAVRDREEVAEGLGVNTARVKLALFVYTAFWAGVAGAFYAGYIGVVSPAMGQLVWMGWIVAMVVVGGLGTIAGPILGVVLVRTLDAAVRSGASENQTLIIGGLLLIFLLFFPDGIVGILSKISTRISGAREKRRALEGQARRDTSQPA